MVYLLVDLENQAQLSDVISFLISRSYNVFHVNNENPCPKCSLVDKIHVPGTLNEMSPLSLPSSRSIASEAASNSAVLPKRSSLPAVESTIQMNAAFELQHPAFPFETMESAAEFEDVKPDVTIIENDAWNSNAAAVLSDESIEVTRKSKRKRTSVFENSLASSGLRESVDESEESKGSKSDTNLWASTEELIKKQNFGDSVRCSSCKWSVQSNLGRMRTHVNNVHKHFHRYRCCVCNMGFVHYAKAARHERSKHTFPGAIVRLKWTPSQVAEIEKTMVKCFGFNV